jgi:hypothetical protein
MKSGILLFILATLISFVILNPKFKQKTFSLFIKSHRIVLSQMDYKTSVANYRIIKLLDAKGLMIEIYRYDQDNMILLDSQTLTDKKDAFYKFGDNKYNLFIKDLNKDGQEEIILPSLDKNLKARLNIFIFDPINEKLEKITQH